MTQLPHHPERAEALPRWLERVAAIGATEGADEEERLHLRVLNLGAALMAAVAPIWIATYASLGHWVSAAIPLAYVLATLALLAVHARRPLDRVLVRLELSMMLVFPFALQWTLGGFAHGSAVALWGLSAPLGAVFFAGIRQALPWFAGFVGLVLVSAAVDPLFAAPDPPIPEAVTIVFFALNFLGVSATVFLLLVYFVRAREAEHQRSEALLLNVLPEPVARRLKLSPGVIADAHPEATVLFADIVNFTPLAERMAPEELVALLDRIFTRWDELAHRHGMEKIKTVGDEYMVVAGLPAPHPDPARAAARMALAMVESTAEEDLVRGTPLQVRIGIDAGPVVAGVIGRSKFIYDLWGDTVNTASRMESTGEPGRIQVTERFRARLDGSFGCIERGTVEVKGKGPVTTYFLDGSAG